MGIYLADGQTFEDVVRQDAEVLKRAGVTHQQVGDALEKVLKSFNWHSNEKNRRVNDTLSVDAVAYRGIEFCPYDNNLIASRDFSIKGIPSGNKGRGFDGLDVTLVTEMMPDLIRKLHFFEGDVRYGIRPEWAIQVYEIVEREGVNIWVPQKKTVYKTGSSITGSAEGILLEDFCGSQKLKANADRVIELAPGVSLYMKSDKGIIFAERDFNFPSDFKIDSLPVNSYDGSVSRGQTFINKQDIIVG